MEDDESSISSSVTCLFVGGNGKQERRGSTYNRTPRNPHNQNVCHSASKALDRYIRDYERSQALTLARSMTEMCTRTPLSRDHIEEMRKSPSLVECEIKMAQTLLPTSSCSSAGELSMEDLLMETPCFKDHHEGSFSPKRSGCSRINIHLPRRHWQVRKPPFHGSFHGRYRGLETRKALIFSTDDEGSSESSSRSIDSCPSDAPSSDDEDLRRQVEDLQKTWRLVDDLKSDAAFPRALINGRRKPPDSSLFRLIERLSFTAKRKEENLQRKLDNDDKESRLHRSAPEPTAERRMPAWSGRDSHHCLDEINRTRHSWKEDCIGGSLSRGSTTMTQHRLHAAARLHGTTSPSSPDPFSIDVSLERDRTRNLCWQGNQSNSDTSSCASSFQTEQLSRGSTGSLATSIASKVDHRGGVEALKNMIFNLQDLTVSRNKGALDNASNEQDGGHDSLRRAMRHLENLKNIVADQ